MEIAKWCYLLLPMLLAACSNATVSPGMTLVTGLSGYHDEMARLAGQPARWPERQRLGDSLKGTHMATMGGSKEFNRLVELDIKRTEYSIALNESSLRPERVTEMKQELVKMNNDIDSLAALIKKQVGRLAAPGGAEPQQMIEGVATIGLLYLAIDAFSSASPAGGASLAEARVGNYTVIDQQKFAMVRAPDGQTFQCITVLVPDEGAGIQCAPLGTR